MSCPPSTRSRISGLSWKGRRLSEAGRAPCGCASPHRHVSHVGQRTSGTHTGRCVPLCGWEVEDVAARDPLLTAAFASGAEAQSRECGFSSWSARHLVGKALGPHAAAAPASPWRAEGLLCSCPRATSHSGIGLGVVSRGLRSRAWRASQLGPTSASPATPADSEAACWLERELPVGGVGLSWGLRLSLAWGLPRGEPREL